MKMRTRILTLAGLALLGSLVLAGCASPPAPCDTDVAELEAARAKADLASREQLAMAKSEKAELKSQIAVLESELQKNGDYDALVAKLEDLKCGSGR